MPRLPRSDAQRARDRELYAENQAEKEARKQAEEAAKAAKREVQLERKRQLERERYHRNKQNQQQQQLRQQQQQQQQQATENENMSSRANSWNDVTEEGPPNVTATQPPEQPPPQQQQYRNQPPLQTQATMGTEQVPSQAPSQANNNEEAYPTPARRTLLFPDMQTPAPAQSTTDRPTLPPKTPSGRRRVEKLSEIGSKKKERKERDDADWKRFYDYQDFLGNKYGEADAKEDEEDAAALAELEERERQEEAKIFEDEREAKKKRQEVELEALKAEVDAKKAATEAQKVDTARKKYDLELDMAQKSPFVGMHKFDTEDKEAHSSPSRQEKPAASNSSQGLEETLGATRRKIDLNSHSATIDNHREEKVKGHTETDDKSRKVTETNKVKARSKTKTKDYTQAKDSRKVTATSKAKTRSKTKAKDHTETDKENGTGSNKVTETSKRKTHGKTKTKDHSQPVHEDGEVTEATKRKTRQTRSMTKKDRVTETTKRKNPPVSAVEEVVAGHKKSDGALKSCLRDCSKEKSIHEKNFRFDLDHNGTRVMDEDYNPDRSSIAQRFVFDKELCAEWMDKDDDVFVADFTEKLMKKLAEEDSMKIIQLGIIARDSNLLSKLSKEVLQAVLLHGFRKTLKVHPPFKEDEYALDVDTHVKALKCLLNNFCDSNEKPKRLKLARKAYKAFGLDFDLWREKQLVAFYHLVKSKEDDENPPEEVAATVAKLQEIGIRYINAGEPWPPEDVTKKSDGTQEAAV